MKAWEEFNADVYLLANDILENLYAQQHQYKGVFYYAFNPRLPYRQTGTDYTSQLKLLHQLQDKGVIAFEAKATTSKTPQEQLGKNALAYGGRTVRLNVRPRELSELLDLTRRYGKRFQTKQNKAFHSARLEGAVLHVAGFAVPLRGKNSLYLLQAILQDQAAKREVWSHDGLLHLLEPSPMLKEPASLVRDTANNVNRRVAAATEGSVPKLLQVRARTVQLDPEFV